MDEHEPSQLASTPASPKTGTASKPQPRASSKTVAPSLPARGWEVADEFEDVDGSAFARTSKRPQFERMLAALRNAEVAGVVVWKLERLTRQQRDLVRVKEACEPHKAFIASVMEPIDTRENYGQFVAELLVAQARMESANTSARQTRKAAEQRAQGLPPTNGLRCFGYAKRYTSVVEEEAAIIREARDRLFARDSLRGVALDLESRGVVWTRGHAFRAHILKRLLTTPTIAGMREYKGTLTPGTWPAIVSPADSLRLTALLERRPGMPRNSPARKYLLTGFVRCGRCGGRMVAQALANRTRRYACRKQPGYPNCGQMSATAEPLEEVVREMILAAVDETALADALRAKGQQDDGLAELVRPDETGLEALSADFYVQQMITRAEFLSARAGLLTRLESNRLKLSKRDSRGVVGPFVGDGGTLRTAWETGSLDWRRSVVGALLESVGITAGRRGRRASIRTASILSGGTDGLVEALQSRG